MGTKEFNFIDIILAKWRILQLQKYIDSGDIILDFGCGYQAYLLKDAKNKIKYGVGIDYEMENRKIGRNIDLLKFRFENKLPFQDKYFDKVFMLAVVEHFAEKDTYKLFIEINRVLKLYGKLILSTPTPFGKKILELLAIKLNIISRKEISDHKKYYSREDFEKIAYKTGFNFKQYNSFQFGINSICVLEKIKKRS